MKKAEGSEYVYRDNVIKNTEDTKLCECTCADDCCCEECAKWDQTTINPDCFVQRSSGGCDNWACFQLEQC